MSTAFKHNEAFCLMTYRDEVTGKKERIWNSRDGVTPFYVGKAHHVEFDKDTFAPEHIPQIGDRVFVTETKASARRGAERNVEVWWADDVHGCHAHYGTKEAMIDELTAAYFGNGDKPAIITVTSADQIVDLMHRAHLEYRKVIP